MNVTPKWLKIKKNYETSNAQPTSWIFWCLDKLFVQIFGDFENLTLKEISRLAHLAHIFLMNVPKQYIDSIVSQNRGFSVSSTF